MNHHEIESFLIVRGNKYYNQLLKQLKGDNRVAVINYKGYENYRLQ